MNEERTMHLTLTLPTITLTSSATVRGTYITARHNFNYRLQGPKIMVKWKAPKAGNSIQNIITLYSFQKRLKDIEFGSLLSPKTEKITYFRYFYENNKSHFISRIYLDPSKEIFKQNSLFKNNDKHKLPYQNPTGILLKTQYTGFYQNSCKYHGSVLLDKVLTENFTVNWIEMY